MSEYSAGLILSNANHKTVTAIAGTFNKPSKPLYDFLENNDISKKHLRDYVSEVFKKKKCYLCIDDTTLKKYYSQFIEGTSDQRDASSKTTGRSLCAIVGGLTDGKDFIPLDNEFWTSKEMAPDAYKTKIEIAIDLIRRTDKELYHTVLIDGLYASKQLIQWLIDQKIHFEIKFHSNRVVKLSPDDKKGIIVRELFEKRLSKGRSTKLVYWHGMQVYLTATIVYSIKRKPQIIYLISNINQSAKSHHKTYSKRWGIEKFFRTAKQYLGLSDCQSRKKVRQEGHVFAVFVAYANLVLSQKRHKLKTPEEAIKRSKVAFYQLNKKPILPLDQIFDCIEA
jgi:hypothetical protein